MSSPSASSLTAAVDAMTPGTRLGTASGTKGLTADMVMSLVAEGTLSLDTRVRDVLGTDHVLDGLAQVSAPGEVFT